MMSCEKDSLYMTNSVNNGQNAFDGMVPSNKHYMLRKIAVYCIRCLIQSLKVVMIWQKDNPDQITPGGKPDLCCHYLPP